MQKQQWYLCEIETYPKHEGDHLKTADSLSVHHPDIFDNAWYVWLPIIPRVGDTLQFRGWQVQVSKVLLETDCTSKTGIQEELVVAARISIRDDVVRNLMSSFSIEALNNNALHKWESFARRGHDLQYFAWELRHEFYMQKETDSFTKKEEPFYYRWHTRIRPFAGDIVLVKDKKWRITSVALESANSAVDGYLYLEALD